MATGSLRKILTAAALLSALACCAPSAPGQEMAVPADFDASKLTPEQRQMMEQAMRRRGGRMPPTMQAPTAQAQPAAETPKPEGEEKPKEEAAAETVKRPTDGAKGDVEELKARPDKDGFVQFSFHGQGWEDVLKWYAEISKSSLDWQALPADKLNLTTQRKYTIDETRNLLNQHLLSRKFTMLHHGDMLIVVEIDKIDPSIVPRVNPDDLEDLPPFDFARVRFELPDDMDPAKAVEDVKVLLNPTPKVTPLLASKQLMVIDAVANLRDVRDLLYGEQLAASADIRPELFPIRYRRADYIASQVMIVLGLDPQSRKEPMELQVEQQRLQLMMQMQQSGKDVTTMLAKDGPPVFIAVDKRRNVITVNAPPKEMEIVRRVVKQFDVPENGLAADEINAGGNADAIVSADGETLTFEKYQTINISPDSIVTALKEIGNLHPLSQFSTDPSSKTIFATATKADHETIKRMMERLDGSGRSLKVVWLSRRTLADQVAGTIQALMVGEKKEENNRSRYYGWYDPYGGRNQEETSDSGFRIQADVENNRLLLWANEAELTEVTALLEELGAISSGNGANPNTWRVMETRSPQETAELLKQLKESWGGSNPLNINVAPPATEPPPAEGRPAAELPADQTPADEASEPEDQLTGGGASGRRPGPQFRLVQLAAVAAGDASALEPANEPAAGVGDQTPGEADAADAVGAAPSAAAPPINITVTPDGRIVISSDDVAALDQMQDLIGDLAPPQKEYAVFQLFNARASSVVINLEEYFDEELAADEEDRFFNWWNDEPTDNGPATLGKRRKLRFIWDPDTNTILVQNASPSQLQVIDQLIKIYDRPAGDDAVSKRKTGVIEVKYSRATDIATALKEVYRDLLSSKDKEFQNERENNRNGGGGVRRITLFSGGGDNSKSTPVKVAFEGALSVGVDTVSNTLIISAEEQVYENVVQIVKSLDEQAKPDTVVQVHEIRGALDAEELQEALSSVLSQPWPGGKPDATAGQNNGGGRGQNGGGGGDRGRRWRGGDRGGDRGRD